MTKYHAYTRYIVEYDHTMLYVIIGIVVAIMVITLIGYAIYEHKKKKKLKEKIEKCKITFIKKEKDITKKEDGE